MAPASAIPQNFPFSLPNHNRSRFFFQNGPNSSKKPARIHPKIRTVAFNGVQIKHTQRNFLEPSLPIRVLVPHSMFLQVGPRKTHSAPRIQAKSMGSDSSSASTSLQSVSGILHLIVSLGIILAMDKVLKKAFMAAAIKFPSALFGMFCVFTILMVLDSTVPAAATSLMNFFEPALLFIQRWLPLFYVPSLVVLPLAVKDIPAASGIKICFILVGGWLASLSVAGYTAIAVRKMVKTEMIPAEPMSKPSPFSPLEVWIWSGTFIVSFVAALFYPTVLGTNARTCLPFLLASTVLGYMVGSRLPAGVKKVFHPIICCALSADLAAFAFGYLSRSGLDPVLGHYLTKASSNPGAGDILMGFLGSVIISFSFSMFKQRKLVKRHAAEIFTSVIIATLFSLYSTALIGRLVGLQPSLTISILPRCITVALALSIVSFFEGANSSLTAAAVVLTGLVGANFVQAMLDKLRFDDPIARGIATASSAHGLGTAALSAKEPVALPFCAIAYALTGIFGSLFCSVPAVRQSLLAIVAAALRHPTVVMKMGAYHNRNPMISDPNTEGSVPHFAWNYPGNIFSATKIGLNPFQASPMDPKPDLFTAVSLHSFAPMTEPAKNDTESETKPTKVKKKKSAAKSSDQNAPKVSRTQKKSSASKKTKKQFEPGTKIERKDPNMVFNEANLDFSVVPPPYCSCTGVARSCYKWGTGGWQSSCCNTNISEYPLPMSPSKPGARVPGRKMSIGAYGKLLCRLAAEGLDLSHPVDLKDHWARHGTNKFVTIKTIK